MVERPSVTCVTVRGAWLRPARGQHRHPHDPAYHRLSVGQMMTILTEFGVESRIEDEDYLQGLAALRKAW
jgi:hypothetical protein